MCTGETGHVEVIRVTYDPQRIDLRSLLEIFFVVHDPTTLNRQGNDVGTQYRSVIFYHNEEQHQLAQHYKEKLNAEKELVQVKMELVGSKVDLYRALGGGWR